MNWKVLAGIAAVVLILSQVVPGVFATLPFLLFLVVCPLMMFFMMRGMGGMAPSGATPAAQPDELANTMAMGGGIAELKAEQAALTRPSAALETKQALVPSEQMRRPAAPSGRVL
ncbi:MAG: DUF2933 domain-containing protein [Candidatus Dormibacteraeota bacterium]|nr:DUF2933 domain-containing protein [Candidatus Dormibacteraeota bacterium]